MKNEQPSSTIVKQPETYKIFQEKLDAITSHKAKFLKQYTFVGVLKFSYYILFFN